jgi:HSP90 family molecular chaperone
MTGEYEWTEKFQCPMNAKTLKDTSMSTYMKPKKTLEVNPIHPVVTNIVEFFEASAENKSTKEIINLFFDMKLLSSDFFIEKSRSFFIANQKNDFSSILCFSSIRRTSYNWSSCDNNHMRRRFCYQFRA